VARSRNLRLWAVAVWALCLLAATAGRPGGSGHPEPHRTSPAAVGALSAAADAAVLPPRVADELRVASSGAPLRVIVLAAVLALLVALPAVLRRTSNAGQPEEQPLRSRRHVISLRAPPLRFA
jgi:hypothetical protein